MQQKCTNKDLSRGAQASFCKSVNCTLTFAYSTYWTEEKHSFSVVLGGILSLLLIISFNNMRICNTPKNTKHINSLYRILHSETFVTNFRINSVNVSGTITIVNIYVDETFQCYYNGLESYCNNTETPHRQIY